MSRAKPASNVSSSAHVKPFAGKVFFLDLPSNRTAEILESDIKELGGVRKNTFGFYLSNIFLLIFIYLDLNQ